MSGYGLNLSRWLDAIWEPNIRANTLPNGLDTLDLTGDGDAKLIALDLGSNDQPNTRMRILKGADKMAELSIMGIPSSVIGFYIENDERKSAAIAVGACSSLLIFKNLKPFFKFCLPRLPASQQELNIWHRASMDEELNMFTLLSDFEQLLREIGAAYISSQTIKFVSMAEEDRQHFFDQYRKLSLCKINVVTIVSTIHKDSWNDIACSYLIVGTELGEILILDQKAFFVIEKYIINWSPVAVTSSGLWTGDGQIVLVGRNGQIGSIERGKTFKSWERLSAPAVAVATLFSEEIAVTMMNGLFILYSKLGKKLWKIQLAGNPLDMVSVPVPQCGAHLLAISVIGHGILIYDQRFHVDTIKTSESVSALKYGQLGKEEHTMAMITYSGGLNIKILKRTAEFNSRSNTDGIAHSLNNIKLTLPKKTKLFIEQTVRERAETLNIHRTFQEGFLRFRLNIARRFQKVWIGEQKMSLMPVNVQSVILGLGPRYIIKIYVTSIVENFLTQNCFIISRSSNVLIEPRVVKLPFIPVGVPFPIAVSAVAKDNISNKVDILLCYKGDVRPINVINIKLPINEEEIYD